MSESATPNKARDGEAEGGSIDHRPVVVGIGASAGGLDALIQFLSSVPENPGMSFVIIQHLDPTHKSRLSEILERKTQLPVHEVEDKRRVEEGHVYVIPPGKYMAIENCVLRLSEPVEARGARMAIDYFFRSLAEDRCEYAIGLVLSGTGTDGTAGLREIKQYGGLTIVQKPADAEHEGMPRSAIEGVEVDWILPASEIAARLARYVRHTQRHGLLSAQADVYKEKDLRPIIDLLRSVTNQDFRRYRKSTMRRRVRRRMGLHHLTDLGDYVQLLKDSTEECRSLRCDMLIGVTQFFRNPQAWKVLGSEVIQAAVSDCRGNEAIRLWCAGCATGEEAYSLAMLCHETAHLPGSTPRFQIFATDVAGDALQIAREGLYPASIAVDVSPERLHRFFVREGDHYRVSRSLRESVVFAEQDVLAHPPFSRLDLIICRNLLIYLEKDAQRRLMDVFQFALKDQGALFLGNSESVRALSDAFTTVSKKWRIYRRSGDPTLLLPSPSDSLPGTSPVSAETDRRDKTKVATLVQRQLLRRLEHGIAVVDAEDRVVYLNGRADLYLQLTMGEVTGERPRVLELAREGLRSKLRTMLKKVRQNLTNEAANGRVRRDGRYHLVEITGELLQGLDSAVLLTFQPATKALVANADAPQATTDIAEDATSAEEVIRELEHELATTRQQLTSTIEDLETANEELKASNEESMAMNEELQSGNEELETSKEELQSLNEELVTLNNQLELKLFELQETTNDLNNLLVSASTPTVFVDTGFVIRRFTPSCVGLFHFIASDVGRSLRDITAEFSAEELFADAESVLADLQPRERNITLKDGRSFLARTLPYRTHDDRIQGVVFTFADVTELRESERIAKQRLAEVETIYAASPVGLAFVDLDLKVKSLSSQMAQIYGIPVRQCIGRSLNDILPASLAKRVVDLHRRVLESGEPILNLEMSGKTPGSDSKREWLASYFPVRTPEGNIFGINSVIQDITEQKTVQRQLAESEERFRQIARATDYVFWMIEVDPERIVYVSPAYEKAWGRSADELYANPRLWIEAIHPDDRQRIRDAFEAWIGNPDQQTFDTEYRITRPDGSIVWIADKGHILPATEDRPLRLTGIARDITVTKTLTMALAEREETFRSVAELIPFGFWECDANGRLVYVSQSFLDKVGMTLTECLQFGWMKCVHPDERDRLSEAWRECQEQLADWEYEHRFLDGDGNEFGVLSRGIPLRDTDGNLVKWVGLNIDINERLRAERELQQSHDTFAELVEDAPFGIYVVDSDLRFRHLSMGSREVFGKLNPVGRNLNEVMHILWDEPFASEAVDRFKHTLATGEPYCSTDMTQVRRDIHESQSYHWQIRRIRLADGELGVVCYFYDLTRVMEAERRVRESEQRLRLGAEVAEMGVISVDYATGLVTVDPLAARLFDLHESDTITRDKLHARFHPDDRPQFEQLVEDALDSMNVDSITFEGRIVRNDGSIRWLNLRKRFFFETDNEGKPRPTHGILAAADITARKGFENALISARDAAESANRARGEFLANMSHEIRTPMTAILGHADMLLAHLKDPDNRQCVATMKRNGNHLLELINDILDLSRLEANKVEVDRGPCNVIHLLSDIHSLMHPRIRDKQLEFEVVAGGLLPKVIQTDDTRLKQILLNLVGNAIKFTDEGSVTIRVECLANEEKIKFAVEDTGIGISQEHIRNLFDAFFQADASDTRVFGGSGLGLTISMRMAVLLGGTLEVQSQESEGSTFTLTLPTGDLGGTEFIEPRFDVTIGEAEDTAPLPTLSAKVLLVDDRRDVRYVAQHFLEGTGATVVTKEDGREAIDEVKKHEATGDQYHLIVMDMQMPKMDGYTAVSELRAAGFEMPIIALTAAAMRGDRERCLQAGCDDYLSKPLSADKLVGLVAELLATSTDELLARRRQRRTSNEF